MQAQHAAAGLSVADAIAGGDVLNVGCASHAAALADHTAAYACLAILHA
jgi:hypothetical protein